ncbi:similar to Saccharomyces cerevisiae YNR009W NRM1 Transcriptional co-repressor of MBF (MCB binding factor)-regulated gene expression [Maudiozyma barnettii]|uniref:Similar to Saccharomyces cerevisiae YNR009W NRM1 Transcriptional co-repressor of MBF (MCB binding factor)-regulated gene expression n=1 Tax=Maudiozyma barnettii TaxID=61262 RepID=A0A8H2ZI16_9SACH|nr:Nrm1p [Kazachstania barnettii]CAB4255398.1 similar to Saccharomyces cerevisiae YNR009W NRM1 Transcriptional co-repressor of MBF (MCB binding factor)-regulated gene expression [Kazachstania barnettii]CAD1783804.1 similar to Saccharomyces cerevisiae YNR009W NRM1 Transcriptional co-repressor of MBF (MCB binding factor)-regulated gene expression [Kazachstania barnettii]
MSLQNYRFPLSDYSNSRMNRLELFGGSRLAGATTTTSMTTLPSIKSLINHTSVDDHQPSLIPQYQHHLHTLPSVMAEPLLERSHSLPIHPLRNYSEISKKLKIRLQFAYYKYKTQQSDLNFADLKCQHAVQKHANVHRKASRKISKRRKLVVSQGNYRTPSKKHTTQPLLNSGDDTIFSKSYNTCVDSSVSTTTINNIKLSNATVRNQNDTTVVNTMTTPIRDQQKINMLVKQETPMSVKAAKSLMHLFTSSSQL